MRERERERDRERERGRALSLVAITYPLGLLLVSLPDLLLLLELFSYEIYC
jgi:hypothetical protein